MKQPKPNLKNCGVRRKVLKGIVSSGGIAGAATISSWSKPVVESVLLPAHAATSAILPDEAALRTFALAGTFSQNIGNLFRPKTTQLSISKEVESRSILNRIIPSAQAQQGLAPGDIFESVLFETETGIFTFQLLIIDDSSQDCIIYSMLSRAGLAEGVPGQLDLDICFGFSAPISPVTVNVVTPNSATVTIEQSIFGPMSIVSNANPLSLSPCPCIDFPDPVDVGLAQ